MSFGSNFKTGVLLTALLFLFIALKTKISFVLNDEDALFSALFNCKKLHSFDL
jgi:hypothetical protein